MVFIEAILIIFVVLYLLGLTGRLLLRLFLRRMQRKFEQYGNGAGGGYYKQYTWGSGNNGPKAPKEGEVKVSDTASHRKINEKVGEYVDYEEIKE